MARCKAASEEAQLNYSEPTNWPIGDAPAPEFCGEEERLVVLASFGLEALEGDEELNRIARFAANLCGVPSAAVSLVEEHRQRYMWRQGLDVSETPRSTSFCARTMLGGEILEVLDATEDPRFADFTLVTGDAHLRYYVGVPLISSEGAPLGALCATDTKVHSEGLNDLQREGLLVLAEAVKRRIETHRQIDRNAAEIAASAEQLRFMLDSVPDIAWSAAPGPRFDYFNARFAEVTGLPPRETVDDWREVIHPGDFEASLAKFDQAMKTASMFEDEWRLRQADGSYRWVLSRAVPSTTDPATARWFGTLTDIDDSYRISQERELLAGELAHRIKNIFSVIIGLISLHARGEQTVRAFADALSENIRALSRAQDFVLRIENQSSEDLHNLLKLLMEPYGAHGSGNIAIAGDTVAAGKRAATPLALIFHELATNSAKYGALSVADGQLSIAVERGNENVRITWQERGGPETRKPENSGFGSRLIEKAVDYQLGGTIVQDWNPGGLRAVITIPLARLAL